MSSLKGKHHLHKRKISMSTRKYTDAAGAPREFKTHGGTACCEEAYKRPSRFSRHGQLPPTPPLRSLRRAQSTSVNIYRQPEQTSIKPAPAELDAVVFSFSQASIGTWNALRHLSFAASVNKRESMITRKHGAGLVTLCFISSVTNKYTVTLSFVCFAGALHISSHPVSILPVSWSFSWLW